MKLRPVLVSVGLWAGLATASMAQHGAQLFVTAEEGYGRLVLSFPGRLDLPAYELNSDNGVLAIEFESPIDLALPDIAATLSDFVSVARVDPDGGGLRVALRSNFNVNHIEAGERLFVDLLPIDWQGMPPGLPQSVIDELAERARVAAIDADRERKAMVVRDLDPKATVRIGRNPTFLRVHFDWTIETDARFVQDDDLGVIAFEWPVEVDVRDLAIDLPEEVLSVEREITPDGTLVHLQFREGLEPRFYSVSPTQSVLDIDLAGVSLPEITPDELAADVAEEARADDPGEQAGSAPITEALRAEPPASIVPFVTTVGQTVRVVFPFDYEVASAVFLRGNTVWMMFDTATGIAEPADLGPLRAISDRFEVMPAGDTQVVRIDLSRDRLATLGSEGRAWVLSLGDMLLSPTEPLTLDRRLDQQGAHQMIADMRHPVRVHQFRDPLVGDLLEVVTAFPPARGVTRSLNFVDFVALRSVHGLVVKPRHDGVDVGIENQLAVVSAASGLTVSTADRPRDLGVDGAAARTSFVDLVALESADPAVFARTSNALLAKAAQAEGRERDAARLELAQHYLANGYAHEAIGVLRTLEADLVAEDLSRQLRISSAIANTLAHRPDNAIAALTSPLLVNEIDALVWRTIARTEAEDYAGARRDAADAVRVIDSYPDWVRNDFLFAGVRAAVETDDPHLGRQLLTDIDYAGLDRDRASLYQLLSGRLEELEGVQDAALATYGQVIASDVRPTRGEAVYRTLKILREAGALDIEKGAQTLAAEAMLWRGGAIESDMLALLAELFFDGGMYRDGFATVREAAAANPEAPGLDRLSDRAQDVFSDLFLNGRADSMGPIDALGLYYDFRQLTPPGTRGDEMIRNLARRLVDVDLLAQAGDLLNYQLENRVDGVARSQVATDLAVIYLADHQPQRALEVLNATRLPGLSVALERQRRLLEARALIDGGRDVLGLDLLGGMSGRDVDLLRIEANWKAGRYADAAQMLEAMHVGEDTLLEHDRMDIIKAAVGYVLGNDDLGLTRLRTKFGERLVTTPQWGVFDYVTSAIEPTSLEFRKVANEVAGIDSLNAFLGAYREIYGGGGGMTPQAVEPGTSETASL